MKLKVLAVSLVAMFSVSATAMAAGPLPENHSPANGSIIEGTALTEQFVEFSCARFATTNPLVTVDWSSYSAEFATNPELNPAGEFATPFKVWSSAARPTNVTEDQCKASYWFGAAKSSTTIYWRAFRLNCQEGPCHEYGPTWSFTPVPIGTAVPIPAPTPVVAPHPVPVPQCERWKGIRSRRLNLARYAAKRFNHAISHGERTYWHAQLKKDARELRVAYKTMKRVCP